MKFAWLPLTHNTISNTMRGILNGENGSTCHIAVAIQFIFHCLPELVDVLLYDATYLQKQQQQDDNINNNINDDDDDECCHDDENAIIAARQRLVAIMLKLKLTGSFWEEFRRDCHVSEAIDASDFYHVLPNVDVTKDGDAVVTLYEILYRVIGFELLSKVDVLRGNYVQTVVRNDNLTDGDGNSQVREKTREFYLSPFPLSLQGSNDGYLTNLPDILHENFLTTQQIEGGGNADIEKSIRFEKFPLHFMCHMKRFSYDASHHQTTKLSHTIRLPPSIDMSQFIRWKQKCSHDSLPYFLKGAIVHVGTSAKGGHYLFYKRTRDDKWKLVDDDLISNEECEEDVLNRINGNDDSTDSDEESQCAMSLLYSGKVDYDSENEDPMVPSFDIERFEKIVREHLLYNDEELVLSFIKYYQYRLLNGSEVSSTACEKALVNILLMHLIPNTRSNYNYSSILGHLFTQISAIVFIDSFLEMDESFVRNLFKGLSRNIELFQFIREGFGELPRSGSYDKFASIYQKIIISTRSLIEDNFIDGAVIGLQFISIFGMNVENCNCDDLILNLLDDDVIRSLLQTKPEVLFELISLINPSTTQYKNLCEFFVDFLPTTNFNVRKEAMTFASLIETEANRIALTLEAINLLPQSSKLCILLIDISDKFQRNRILSIIKSLSSKQICWKILETLLIKLLKRKEVVNCILELDLTFPLLDVIQSIEVAQNDVKSYLEQNLHQLSTLRLLNESEEDRDWKIDATYDSDDDPESVINKRVSVRWSKGTWYNGLITEFHSMNGKHKVLYDDGKLFHNGHVLGPIDNMCKCVDLGDERYHNLLKKSIKFL